MEIISDLKASTGGQGGFIVRQEPWSVSPCSGCEQTPCCKNLPLTSMRMNRQVDFINILLLSCYEGLMPALKKSGEWNIFLRRSCRYLDSSNGKCLIHQSSSHSMICKSYDAHNCWYRDAFKNEKSRTMIAFDTGMLIWFEKKYRLIENRFLNFPAWSELCEAVIEYENNKVITVENTSNYPLSITLPFRDAESGQYLFFPPYERPKYGAHFELLMFRLGFPGISLGLTDSLWAFVVRTELKKECLGQVRDECYPSIGHNAGVYSFQGLIKEFQPYSSAGARWIMLERPDLDTLKELTEIDVTGKIRRLPSCSVLLKALTSKNICITV